MCWFLTLQVWIVPELFWDKKLYIQGLWSIWCPFRGSCYPKAWEPMLSAAWLVWYFCHLFLYSYCLVGLFLPLRSEKWTTRGRGRGSWGRAAGTNSSHHKPLSFQHHLLHELLSGGHHHRHHTGNRHRDSPSIRVPRGDASESPEVRRSLLVTVCSSLLYLHTNTSL